MDNPSTAAEYAQKLYNYLDSSAGEYNEILKELESASVAPVDNATLETVISNIQDANTLLDDCFNLLDNQLITDNTVSYESGSMFFTDEVPRSDLREVKTNTEKALKLIEATIDLLQKMETEQIQVDFGVYSEAENAVSYLQGELEFMNQLATQLA